MNEWIDKITLSFEKHFKTYCIIIALLTGFNLFFHLARMRLKIGTKPVMVLPRMKCCKIEIT